MSRTTSKQPVKGSVDIGQWRAVEAEKASTLRAQLDLDGRRNLPATQDLDHRRKCLRDLLRSQWPLPALIAVERVAEDDTGIFEAQQRPRSVIQSNQTTVRVDHEQRIGHIGKDRFRF